MMNKKIKPNSTQNFLVLGVFMLCASVMVSGCEQYDASELELLKRDDPKYKNLIDEKDRINLQVDTIESELGEKRNILDEKIQSLKDAYNNEASQKKAIIQDLNSKASTNKQRYEEGYLKSKETLSSKKLLEEELTRALQDANDILARKQTLELSSQEYEEWQTRVVNLEAKLKPLREEITKLESDVQLKKKKLKYL